MTAIPATPTGWCRVQNAGLLLSRLPAQSKREFLSKLRAELAQLLVALGVLCEEGGLRLGKFVKVRLEASCRSTGFEPK